MSEPPGARGGLGTARVCTTRLKRRGIEVVGMKCIIRDFFEVGDDQSTCRVGKSARTEEALEPLVLEKRRLLWRLGWSYDRVSVAVPADDLKRDTACISKEREGQVNAGILKDIQYQGQLHATVPE